MRSSPMPSDQRAERSEIHGSYSLLGGLMPEGRDARNVGRVARRRPAMGRQAQRSLRTAGDRRPPLTSPVSPQL